MARLERPQLALFASGGGTTVEAIIVASGTGKLKADIGCIVASSPTAGVLDRARRLHLPESKLVIADPKEFKDTQGRKDPQALGDFITSELEKRDVTDGGQHGWMPLTPRSVIEWFDQREGHFINQHPGTPEVFGGDRMFGMRVLATALLYWRFTKGEHPYAEMVAQKVAPQFDEGDVVKAERVTIFKDDTVETLRERSLPVEHKIQIGAYDDIAHGELHVVQGREPIVTTDEERELLRKAKEAAIALYPKG